MQMNPDIIQKLPSPCYVVDETVLERNLQVLEKVQERTKCKILLALKGFAMPGVFPLIKKYLHGVAASSPDEAQLGKENFGGEVHVCAPGYDEKSFPELLKYADHIVFNSFSQWEWFRQPALSQKIECGLRLNPEVGFAPAEIYNPCGRYSRFGVTEKEFPSPKKLESISGFHIHALCEQNADALEPVAEAMEKKFGKYFSRMKWLNLGGGHHITRENYDVEKLCAIITRLKNQYDLEIYLEPGEAVALNTGFLVATVLDIVRNEMDIAILDVSAAAHMPDVLEMPYRPHILGAEEPKKLPHNYRLAGPTCLAGDVVGDYSFAQPLCIGSLLVFTDMAHYTMVKNNTFNGVRLPSIATYNSQTGKTRLLREFSYQDYRSRLG